MTQVPPVFVLIVALLQCCWCPIITVLSLSTSSAVKRQPLGRVTSLDRTKLDTTPDTSFYREPKLVTHTDAAFIDKLKGVYQDYLLRLNNDDDDSSLVILDMMSSHISHLPQVVVNRVQRLDVHGMNRQELEQNTVRNASSGNTYLRNLNDRSDFVGLCDETATYDAVLCCAGIQYLEEAETVLADVARILKPGTGIIIISFTNRFFYQKALQGWINRGMQERGRLVTDYLRAAGGYEDIQILGDGTSIWNQLTSLSGISGDPFVAVVAKRTNEP